MPALIVHGGAGADPASGREELRRGIRDVGAAGWAVLHQGGGAVDAVEAAVCAMEDNPRFNAGRGSVLTTEGTVEMDASIMEGDGLTSGAVACVTAMRHPISLARRTIDILKVAADPMHACQVAMDVLVEEGRGGGGLICIDWKDRLGWAHSTPLMPVGFMSPGHDAPALTF